MLTNDIEIVAADLMPKDENAQRILLKRAELIAQQKINELKKVEMISYIIFRLGTKEYYGIPYQSAKEVMRHATLTKLPHSPSYVAGIINRRGALLTILDLNKFFNIQSISSSEKSENAKDIIVVSDNKMTVGILTDHIEGSDQYEPNRLDSALSTESLVKPEYVIGLDKAKIAIINISTIIADIKLNFGKI